MSGLKYKPLPNVFRCEQQRYHGLTYSPYSNLPQGFVALAEFEEQVKTDSEINA
jgi:hypothetical protein